MGTESDRLTYVDAAAFRALVRGARPLEHVGVLKGAHTAAEPVGGPDSRVLLFTITTQDVDRENDVIKAAGWKTDAFEQNPVVLFAHDHLQPPVAQALVLQRMTDRIKAPTKFATREEYAFADTIYRLYLGGYMRAVSVGFRPLEFDFAGDREGMDFKEQELLEYSCVPVPANPYALLEARSKGIDTAPVRHWAERTLDLLRHADDKAAERDVRKFLERLRAMSDGEGRKLVVALGNMRLPAEPQTENSSGLVITDRRRVFSGDVREVRAEMPGAPQPVGDTCPKCGGTMRDGTCPDCGYQERCADELDKGSVPGNVSTKLAAEDTAWDAPALQDFTDQQWADLPAAERSRIARHFAWAREMPPATFGDLKLPHHRASDGSVVWRGVANAAARLGQADIPAADLADVRAHLAAHYRAFGHTPPWEDGAEKHEIDDDVLTLDGEPGAAASGPEPEPEPEQAPAAAAGPAAAEAAEEPAEAAAGSALRELARAAEALAQKMEAAAADTPATLAQVRAVRVGEVETLELDIKAGRVLSRANETALQQVCDELQAVLAELPEDNAMRARISRCYDLVESVLQQLAKPEPVAGDGNVPANAPAAAAAAEHVLVLDEDEAVDADPDLVRRLVREAMRERLMELTGRLD